MGPSRSSRSSSAQFASLEPRFRRVSQAMIRKKWKRLPNTSQELIREIITELKQQSKLLKAYQKSSVSSCEVCIDQVADRLIDRLPRMPFPTSANDETFNLELTLHRSRNIEEQLTANTHAMHLLRTQITREEQLLEVDQKEIEQLEANLKSSNTARGQQAKNLHILAQSLGKARTEAEPEPQCAVQMQHVNSMFLSQDTRITPLTKQLRNHLDSMLNNTATMRPLLTAVEESSRALRQSKGQHA